MAPTTLSSMSSVILTRRVEKKSANQPTLRVQDGQDQIDELQNMNYLLQEQTTKILGILI